jgi:hypothetical protein
MPEGLAKREGMDLTAVVARLDEMWKAAGMKESFALDQEKQ